MKTFFRLILMVCSIPSSVFAQAKPDSLGPWNHRVIGTFTFTQVSYSNWAQGGQSALAYTATLDGRTQHNSEKTNWATTYKFAYGQTSVADQGFRKTDDKVDLQSVFTYKYGSYINPYVSATLKTQFAQGLKYDNEGHGTVVSAFFDPAFLTQAAGVGYQPLEVVKSRFGAALREIITSKFRGYSDDPTTTRIENVKIEGGVEWVTEVAWNIDDNALLSCKLELFSPIKKVNQVVVRGDNTLAVKVGKYITVNLNVQFINEQPVTPKTQVKQSLAVGLSYALL
jgi:hypothetical protein